MFIRLQWNIFSPLWISFLYKVLKRRSRSAFWACKLRRHWGLRSSGILRGVCW